jgi:hypothetical protein
MREVSVSSGLGPDAIRGILRNPEASPRPATLSKLAKALGVDIRVLRGELPMPDVGAAKAAPAADPKTALYPHPHSDVRNTLREAVRVAMRQALADGMSQQGALADVVLAGMLFAVANGLDDIEAARTVGGIGIQY